MNTWLGAIPFFTEEELACRCCGTIKLDLNFAAKLPALRAAWGAPLRLSSVCRCSTWNKSQGGHPTSLHLIVNPKYKTSGAMAADVKWRQWEVADKLKFARLAWAHGFSVGLHDGFCHVDLRTAVGKLQTVYLYSEWAGQFDVVSVMSEDSDEKA